MRPQREEKESKVIMASFDKKSIYAPLMLGFIFFYMVVGLGPLDPTNLSWIFGRFDPPQHYLGWVFYRNSLWSFPVGLNPTYGIDIGNSIVFTDSLPVLAIPLKFLSPLLPNVFQFIGIWLLLCYLLQALFSWKILSLASNNFWILLLGAALLAFAPPMFWRAYTPSGTQAALAAHFLILAAFYFILKKDLARSTLYWGLLLSIAALTHFYLFAMVAALWISDLLDRVISIKMLKKKEAAYEVAIISAIVLLCAWQAGYFAISSSAGVEQGYGFLKLNLFSPIDPNGWSYVLPTIPIQTTWGEGFNYLGLGVMLAIFLAISLTFFAAVARHYPVFKRLICLASNHRFLLIALILLFLDAISNNVGVGAKEFHFDLPAFLYSPLNVLRSSARMYWPIHYGLIICALFIIIRLTSTKISIAILGLFVVIQIVDTSNGWLSIRQNLSRDMSEEIHSPLLKSPFWKSAATHYKKIIRISAGSQTPYWLQFASLAADNHLTTNSVYLARIDKQQVINANIKLMDTIKDGNYDPEAFYILEDQHVIPAQASTKPGDMLAKIDKFTVLAPGWLKCGECFQPSKDELIQTNYFKPRNQDLIEFSDQPKDQKSIFYLGKGWSWQESWGTWSDGSSTAINIPLPQHKPSKLILNLKAFVITDIHPIQPLDILINGKFFKSINLTQFENNILTIPLSDQMMSYPLLNLEFRIKNPGQPSKLISNNKDRRELGIGITSARFE